MSDSNTNFTLERAENALLSRDFALDFYVYQSIWGILFLYDTKYTLYEYSIHFHLIRDFKIIFKKS